jgi:hypothetical protein
MTEEERIVANLPKQIGQETTARLKQALTSLRDDLQLWSGKITVFFAFDRAADKCEISLRLHEGSTVGDPTRH